MKNVTSNKVKWNNTPHIYTKKYTHKHIYKETNVRKALGKETITEEKEKKAKVT